MRRRNRGRGSSRGSRGGGSTSSRNNSTSSISSVDSVKTTTILTTFQRQSSPYIRQLRGGSQGRSIKSAINSVISDNDIMNNNTSSSNSYPRNGIVDPINGKVNGLHGKLNGETPDGYLHKKFKKVTTAADIPPLPPPPKNGIIIPAPSSSSHNSHNHNNTLTLIRGDEEKSSQQQQGDGNGVVGTSGVATVYKPKFRLSTTTEPNLQNFDGELDKLRHKLPNQTGTTTEIVQKPRPSPNQHRIHVQSFSPEMLNNTSNSSSPEKRLDRKSLDDRISKIINENQSILATWPEHLTKRSKGNGGRYSLSSRPGSHSFSQNFGEPSRRESLDFVMSTGILPRTNRNSISPRSTNDHHFSRSNSDLSQFPTFYEDPSLIGEDLSKASSESSFMVPKKRRRLSPVPGILSGGEVSELPKNNVPLSLSQNILQQNFPGKKQDIDMTVRVSNCGNSGAKVTIRTPGPMDTSSCFSNAQGHHRLTNDDSSNSSSTSSSISNFSPDSRYNLIRIRKDSIFETDSPSSVVTKPPPPISPPDNNKRRGRPFKPREEPPKIRKVVEKLQSHLNAKTAAMAAMAKSTPSKDAKKSFFQSGGTIITQQPITSSSVVTYNHNANKVPVPPNNPTISIPPDQQQHEIQDRSSLLIQTTALNPKRPTFLALKPTNAILAKKRIDQLACILPSPETPRGAKNYNQMHINGNAYTYLGFKISTKPSYTCLFKPQPMFVPQETDPKLSMYSNWQPRPRDSNDNPQLKLSSYDSRINWKKSPDPLYIVSVGNSFQTLTVNSPDTSSPKSSVINFYEPPSFITTKTSQVPSSSHVSHSHPPVLSIREREDRRVEIQIHEPLTPSPPPPDSPKLTIDERPVTERERNLSLNFNHLNVPSTPSNTQDHQIETRPRSNTESTDGNVERSPRYRKKGTYLPPCTSALSVSSELIATSSESSVDDFPGNGRFRENGKGRSVSLCIDGGKNDSSMDLSQPLSLTIGGVKDRQRSQSVSLSSPSAILSNLDSARIKIMEGGFETNEDYTYVRGRGRGRYVCESCGIRCKKPSMLRKHLKTHTDLRPYTCKLCNFSFKTKGNLTKHQKSKSHHKKCAGLGIHPNSSRSLEMTGPISDCNTTDEGDTDSDDEDDDENDSDSGEDQEEDSSVSTDNNDKEKFEKEIALSLLDLSQISRMSEKRDRSMSENDPTLPAVLTSSNRKNSSFSSPGLLQTTSKNQVEAPELEAPMDLSVKTTSRTSVSETHSKFFGGGVKSMEIVGEAQRWEPEEDFLRNGYLNLTKVRNNLEIDVKKSSTFLDAVKVEVPEPPPPAIEDKPFEYEITKRRRLSTTTTTSSTAVSIAQNSSRTSSPLVVSVHPSNCVETILKEPTIPPVTVSSQPKRLHQPWLSPQGSSSGIESELISKRKRTESCTSTGGDAEANYGNANEKEETIPQVTASNSGPLQGENGMKIPSTSNGITNSQLCNGFLGVKAQAEFRQPSGAQLLDEGKAECNVCGKTFARAGQLILHMNIHYLERPFRCDPCGVSFRLKGHLLKHRRSSSHDCKVYLTEAWGVANEENPRPFKCADCKIAFRIHGHLAKHLRSKMHIMRMECLGKLPFGIYFEMEKSGLNLNEIDTTDCDMSLVSLQNVAQKIYGEEWRDKLSAPIEDPV